MMEAFLQAWAIGSRCWVDRSADWEGRDPAFMTLLACPKSQLTKEVVFSL